MSSNTYQRIYNKAVEKDFLDAERVLTILEQIQKKKNGRYISLEKITEDNKVTEKQISKLLVILVKESVLKKVYKVYCPVCGNFSNDIFDDLVEVEDYETCNECGKQVFDSSNPMKYLVLYFRVIGNE